MWRVSIKHNSTWRITPILLLVFSNVVLVTSAPSGIPFAPAGGDPFAPPPSPPATHVNTYNNPFAPQPLPLPPNYHNAFPMQPPPQNTNTFPMQMQQQQQQPQPQPQIQPVYNNQYMAPPPVYSPIRQGPPPDAAPVGATAPSSSTGEMEFESGSGNSGGGGSSNYIYPPQPNYSAYSSIGQYSPHSLLDAYYHQPFNQYQQGLHYYQQYLQNQRRRNDMFGGMFGGTPSGNMFGALMLNEFVF